MRETKRRKRQRGSARTFSVIERIKEIIDMNFSNLLLRRLIHEEHPAAVNSKIT